ncbi:DUF3993 domain-containing protein [Ferdinandcohnia sp. Marseille-Q9671]
MSKRIALFMVVLCLFGLVITQPVNASSKQPLSNDQVFTLLQEAFQAQSSLTFEFRTYEAVQQILSPYFDEQYSSSFLEENLMKEEEGYIVYGSDFALYFIPFFSYTEETKVMYDKEKEKIFVYELFKTPESGPVSYDDHYEVITIEKRNEDWLITELSMQDEPPIIQESVEKKEDVEEAIETKLTSFHTWNPFKMTIYSLLEMESRTPLYAGYFHGIF